ncbi:MAG: phospho-sugar mutase, partial [Clostridium perfringens]
CIDGLRNDALKEMNGVKVITSFDYKLSKEVNNLTGEEKEVKLPKSNVLKYVLEDDSWFVVRPSGTEPKMKIYLSVKGSSLEDSKEKTENFKNAIMEVINAKLK